MGKCFGGNMTKLVTSISKKNISNYSIIIDNKITPIKVDKKVEIRVGKNTHSYYIQHPV